VTRRGGDTELIFCFFISFPPPLFSNRDIAKVRCLSEPPCQLWDEERLQGRVPIPAPRVAARPAPAIPAAVPPPIAGLAAEHRRELEQRRQQAFEAQRVGRRRMALENLDWLQSDYRPSRRDRRESTRLFFCLRVLMVPLSHCSLRSKDHSSRLYLLLRRAPRLWLLPM
jgi:hypothetical protein